MIRRTHHPRAAANLGSAAVVLLGGLLLIVVGLTVDTDPLPYAELVGIVGGTLSVVGALAVAYFLARDQG